MLLCLHSRHVMQITRTLTVLMRGKGSVLTQFMPFYTVFFFRIVRNPKIFAPKFMESDMIHDNYEPWVRK
jgi:hypothetical protein